MGCDGTGQCSKMPLDDKTCGVIDCDKLDTKCRDYHDLTANRCDSLGSCKTANTTTTCTKYTDVCTDAGPRDLGTPDRGTALEGGANPDSTVGKEAGLTPDKGTTSPPADGSADDGCSVAPRTSPPELLILLLGLGFLVRRRGPSAS